MSHTAIVLLSNPGLDTARRIKAALGDAEIWGLQNRVHGTDRQFTETAVTLQRLYGEGATIIGLCAAGILIRSLAPSLTDKRGEPPVLAVSDNGHAIVPLLGGLTGANELARRLAAVLSGEAAITASGSRRYGLQLESPPAGYVLANPEDAKAVTATLLGGASARIEGKAPWLDKSDLPVDANGPVLIRMSPYRGTPPAGGLLYHPRTAAAFVNGAPAIGMDELRAALAIGDIADQALGAIVLPEGTEPAPSLRQAAASLGCAIRFLTADGEMEPASAGCVAVSEQSGVILALADTPEDLSSLGRPLGRLAVVGLGPGDQAFLTGEARDALAAADDLVGYATYLDLVPKLRPGQRRHPSGNRVELDRARQALDLAAKGRQVVLVSSGDPGIFAMAAAVMEVLETEPKAWPGIDVEVVPGISAMQAAAARVGAPLGHDFCVVSLSDIRKPWEAIERRLTAAAKADFVIAIYNPASKTRRDQIVRARDILLHHRPQETPVIVGHNLGRDGESVAAVTLQDLDLDTIDMRTVLIVGSSRSRVFDGPGGRPLAYSPRSYD